MSAITSEMEWELESEVVPAAQEMETEQEYEGEEEYLGEEELEAEDEYETEGEYEQEYEAEEEFETEAEFEEEQETEAESEAEAESFFNHLAAMADRGGRSQALRRIGLTAAREALRSYTRRPPPTIEGEEEFEDESFMLEAELNPLQAEHANAMMEHLSHQAAAAETEDEAAEQFLPLIPLAAKFVLPMVAKAGAKFLPKLAKSVMPHLARGVARVTRTLHRSKAARPLLRAMPHIAKRTVAHLARSAARGHPITPRTAVRTLARQTARVLSHPGRAVSAFRRSRALDRRYHTAARPLVGRPVSAAHPHRHVRGRYWTAPGRRWKGHYRRHPGQYHPGYRQRPVYRPPVVGRPVVRRTILRRPLVGAPVVRQPVAVCPATGRPVRVARTTPIVQRAVPAPGYVTTGPAPAAAPGVCQCFRPVSCASCVRPGCPTCGG